jgi:hypothetical protein
VWCQRVTPKGFLKGEIMDWTKVMSRFFEAWMMIGAGIAFLFFVLVLPLTIGLLVKSYGGDIIGAVTALFVLLLVVTISHALFGND